ncbi:PTS sugar transporter subunit IIA [Enterococcus olivae]
MEQHLTENFSIADVITEDLVNLELKATTKEEVIIELTKLLYQNDLITDIDGFSEDVFDREKEGMTGLGQGIAIPHGKSDCVVKTSLVVGKTLVPIEWESLDDEPVNVIILFAVRNLEANTLHIKLLQKVAMLLADETFIEDLHQATTKKEMIDLLSKKPE